MSPNNSATLLGTRGSVPVSGAQYEKYGGATLCVFLRLGGSPLIIDCGTGLFSLAQCLAPDEKALTALLSHAHADHILGLAMAPIMFDAALSLDIHAAARAGETAQEQLARFFSPPLWPVGISALPAKTSFHELCPGELPGGISADFTEGSHPGGVSVMRVSGGGKTVVYCSDCSLDEQYFTRIKEFAASCDLLLCDGQFTREEQAAHPGFGHSSWQTAARLAEESGAKKLRIIHHAPFRSDAELDEMQASLKSICPGLDYSFGRDGEEIDL
jgi:ribonuclease BN (tRNA processing enzyme)